MVEVDTPAKDVEKKANPMSNLFKLRKPANENPLALELRGEKPVTSLSKPVVPTLSTTSTTPTPSVPLSSHPSWPSFPACEEKLRGCEGWLSCVSVFRALGNKAGQVQLRRRLKAHAADMDLWQETPLTHEWDQRTLQWYELAAPQTHDKHVEWAVPLAKLNLFIGWALKHSRKTREEKLRLFGLFNVQLDEKEAENVQGPIENELLAVLSQCLPFKIEFQYRVGKYRLDAFIPRLRLGIQIDEHGHRGYNEAEEKEYDEVIRDHNIVCLRFNPDQKGLPGVSSPYELVRQVWARTLSPDFGAFREKYQLV